MSYFEQIDKSRIPNHVAIIMDGNGRWAKERGLARIYGHQQGVDVLHDIITTVAETGVKYLTMYAFSLENWNRPKDEVSSLMDIAVELIRRERSTLIEKNVRLLTLGDNDLLPDKVKDAFMECEEVTKNNTGLTLIFALSYSSRWEITEMAKRIARQAVEGKVNVEDISEDYVSSQLSTGLLGIPDPDLLIRTSGEQRISNYLLWQIAYSELYFTQCRWPDFNDEEFYKAIVDYQHRERRFGKTSEQIK